MMDVSTLAKTNVDLVATEKALCVCVDNCVCVSPAAPADVQTSLLPTSCPDCLVFKFRINARGITRTHFMFLSKTKDTDKM